MTMGIPRASRLLCAAAALGALHAPTAPAAAQTVTVSAQCNIYGSGHSGPRSSCDTSIGPGILPVQIDLPPYARLVEFYGVSGTVQYCPTCQPANGPDGISMTFSLEALAGISGISSSSRGRFFEGLFLTDAEPADPAPPALSFTDYGFPQLSPLIAQHFFVGDGLTGTGTGTVQQFFVPAGATRLFLGFSDGFVPCVGAYSDNTGSVTATVAVTACLCHADYNCDGFVDGIDYDQFNNDFEAGNPSADYNGDGFVDGIDYDQFNNDFEAGC